MAWYFKVTHPLNANREVMVQIVYRKPLGWEPCKIIEHKNWYYQLYQKQEFSKFYYVGIPTFNNN